jgi:hypothetical protein
LTVNFGIGVSHRVKKVKRLKKSLKIWTVPMALGDLFFGISWAYLPSIQPMNWLDGVESCLQHSNQYKQNKSNFFTQS